MVVTPARRQLQESSTGPPANANQRSKGARTGAGLGRAIYKWDEDSFLDDEHVLKLNDVADYTTRQSIGSYWTAHFK